MLHINILLNIIKKDFLHFFRNKTIMIVIFLPVLAALFFVVIADVTLEDYYKLGYVLEDSQQEFKPALETDISMNWQRYHDSTEAFRDLQENLDGVLLIDGDKFTAHLNLENPTEILLIERYLEKAVQDHLNYISPYRLTIINQQEISATSSIIPIWLTVTIAMIGIIIISGDLAEEKENQSLNSIHISPVSTPLFLSGKILSGSLLSLLTGIIIFTFAWLNNFAYFSPAVLFQSFFLILSGSIIYNIIGVIIGLQADSQAAARSLGTLVYFPVIMPALIYNFSNMLPVLARFTPTYYLLESFNRIILKKQIDLVNWHYTLYILFFALILTPVLMVIYKGVYK